MWMKGNDKAAPERVDSYELGAKGYLAGGLDYAVDIYYQRVRNRITKMWGSLWPSFPIVLYSDNVRGVDIGRGVELEVGYSPSRRLRAFTHYTYQHITSHDTLDLYAIPQSKAGAGCRWRSDGGLSVAASANWVKSHDEYNIDDFFLERVLKVDSHVRLDGRVAQSFWDDRAELALIGHNLLEPNHVEYPLTRVARQVYAQVSLGF
jgi:outer membrane receptor protein involved in Fe transport